MGEISVSQLHEAFSSFIQKLNEKKDSLYSALEFQMGTSSSFSCFVNTVTSKIIPIIDSLTKEYISLYKDNVRISTLYESEIQKSDLFENAYSEVSTFLTQTKDQDNYLWSIVAAFAALLLQSDSENVELHFKEVMLIERLKSEEFIIKQLQNKVKSLEQLKCWIFKEIEDLFTAPDLLLNASSALKSLLDSFNDTKIKKIENLENDISNLNSKIGEINADSKIKQKAQQDEIEDLKSQNLSLNETIDNQNEDIKKLHKNINELNEKLKYLNYEFEKKAKMEKAINNLCDSFPFLSFNGNSFDYKVEDVSQQYVLEKTLLSTRKQNNELINQVAELKDENNKAKISYEKELKNAEKMLSYEIDALKLQLKRCNQKHEEAILESRQLKKSVTNLMEEKLRTENKFKQIIEENQTLKARCNEIKSREYDQFTHYQENLSQLSEFVATGSTTRTASLAQLKEPSKFISFDVPKIFSSNSIFTAQLESTPESVVFKEANENLQKENDNLKKEKEKFSDEIKKLSKEISELKASKTELEHELNDTKSKVASTEKSVNEWQQHYEKLVSSIKQSDHTEDSKVTQLEEQLKESLTSCIDMQTKINEMENDAQKSKKLIEEKSAEIDKLQQDLLLKELKLRKAENQITDANQKTRETETKPNKSVTDLVVAEKDKEIQKLRDENEEFKNHINLLETQIENNHQKHQQLQQQIQLMTKKALDNSTYDIDPSEPATLENAVNNNTVKVFIPRSKDQKPIPAPETEEPEIREINEAENEETENVPVNQTNEDEDEAVNNEVDNQEGQDFEHQEDDAENNDPNDDGQNDDEDENSTKQEDPTENIKENADDGDADQEKAETEKEIEPEPEKETETTKEKQKETSSQYQHHNQADRNRDTQDRNRDTKDRNRDTGRDRQSNFMRRSQSTSMDKSHYQQNRQKSANTSNTSNNQKPKGQPERRNYQKRSNPKRKK